VVLLHGLARTHHSLAGLRRHLERAGFPTWARSYPSRRWPIADAADQIAEWLAHDLPGDRPLVAVTHSLGGLVARHLATRVALRQIVMLAPPNHGSRVSRFYSQRSLYRWFFGPAGQELAALNAASVWPSLDVPVAIIAGTRGRALANPTGWLSRARGHFAAEEAHDGTLAVDETALPGMAAFATVDASHTWIMNDAQARALVVRFLETRSFAAAREVGGGM
jgi:pimeloyl-ACP methyl ester carboxylesterase